MLLSPRLVPLLLCASLVPLAGCNKDKSETGGKSAADGKASGGAATAKGPQAPANAKKISAIDVGALSSCALLDDGTARCWGANIEGQLGIGKTADELLESYTPVAVVGISGAKKLWHDASYSWSGGHSDGYTDTGCAQTADGSVKCWGHNGSVFGDGEFKINRRRRRSPRSRGSLDTRRRAATPVVSGPTRPRSAGAPTRLA